MKNITEILKTLNIELTEDQVKALETEIKANYKTIADYDNQKKKLEVAEQNSKDIQNAFDEFKKGFEGVNVEELKEKVGTLTETLNTTKADYEKKIKTMELDNVLSSLAKEMGCKDYDLAKTQFDYEKLLNSNNQTEEAKAMFTSLKESKPILFDSEEKGGNTQKGGIIGTVGSSDNSAQYEAQLRAAMGLDPIENNK